jgi:hypothetical protein
VTGSAQAGAGREALAFHPPGDVRVLLPVTWDGESGLAGNSVVVGSAPPPSQLEAVRYGSELAVSWHWPDGDYQMEAAWSGAGARSGRRRLDQAGYRRDGGLRIADADQVTRVSVATVARGGGVEHVGDAVTIVVDAARPVFSYTLRLPRGLFGGREAQVEVTSGGFRGTAEFVAVIAPGRLMPERPDEGQEIARLRLSFAAGRTRQAAFSLPKVPRPYWVRLFPVAGDRIALEDPPTWTMKG